MSAITILPQKDWVVPKWIFSYLSEAVLSRLPNNSVITSIVNKAIIDGSNWFSVQQLEKEDRTLFFQLVRDIYDDIEKSGPARFSTVEGYESLKRRIGELVDLTRDCV